MRACSAGKNSSDSVDRAVAADLRLIDAIHGLVGDRTLDLGHRNAPCYQTHTSPSVATRRGVCRFATVSAQLRLYVVGGTTLKPGHPAGNSDRIGLACYFSNLLRLDVPA